MREMHREIQSLKSARLNNSIHLSVQENVEVNDDLSLREDLSSRKETSALLLRPPPALDYFNDGDAWHLGGEETLDNFNDCLILK